MVIIENPAPYVRSRKFIESMEWKRKEIECQLKVKKTHGIGVIDGL